jgi:xylose isomerase
MGLELDNLGRFMQMARDYGRKMGFKGDFLHRAQAQGADEASVRFRRGDLH